MDPRTPSGHNSDPTVREQPEAEVNSLWSVTHVIPVEGTTPCCVSLEHSHPGQEIPQKRE